MNPYPIGTRIRSKSGSAKDRTGTVERHHYDHGYLCYVVLLDATETALACRRTYPASQIEALPQPAPDPCAS